MSKSRIMGAGNASASRFISLNGPQGGGSKKQGLPPTIGRFSGIDYAKSYGNDRNVVFYVNQLGGVGKGKSMFASNADGVNRKDLYTSTSNNFTLNQTFYGSTGSKPCCSDPESGYPPCGEDCVQPSGGTTCTSYCNPY